MKTNSFIRPLRNFKISPLLCIVLGLTASPALAAKRDLSAFKGNYVGQTNIVLGDTAYTGTSKIRFKTKSRHRAADVEVTAIRMGLGGDLPLSSNYILGRNGKASVQNVAPTVAEDPSLSAKYKTKKRRITSTCPFLVNGASGFVKLTIKRRATKKRTFLKVQHDVYENTLLNPPKYRYLFEGSRRLKRK